MKIFSSKTFANLVISNSTSLVLVPISPLRRGALTSIDLKTFYADKIVLVSCPLTDINLNNCYWDANIRK